MSRRTQLTTKYLFQVMAQLSENFIFIYLGLDLFAESNLQFKPIFILVAIFGICLARYLAVFPLSRAINWFIRQRARRQGKDEVDELPFAYQAMLFWAGLRGAVGVALAAGLKGVNAPALRATVLVVVVLTVIIFGGTTARMLEILGIRTGVVDEADSDDEFDIEVTHPGTYYKRNSGIGYTPSRRADWTIPLGGLGRTNSYSSGNSRIPSPKLAPTRGSRRGMSWQGYTNKDRRVGRDRSSTTTLLGGPGKSQSRRNSWESEEGYFPGENTSAKNQTRGDGEDSGRLDLDLDDGISDDDLPPSAPLAPARLRRSPSQQQQQQQQQNLDVSHAASSTDTSPGRRDANRSARETLRGILSGGPSGDHGAWFRQLDEDYIKPTLLLDQSNHKGPGAV